MGVFLLLLTTIIWFSDFFIKEQITISGSVESISAELNNLFKNTPFYNKFLSFILAGVNAFLIGQLNNRFTILRNRSFLPILLYAIAIACWPDTHSQVMTHITLSLFILSLFSLFRIYRNRNASEPVFLSSLLIATASLIYEPMILYIPLIWVGLSILYSFTFRHFLATILGVLAPWVLFFVIKYLQYEDFDWIYHLQYTFYVGFDILLRPLHELIYIVILMLLNVIVLINISMNIHQDSMQSRALISLNTWILITSTLFSFVFRNTYVVFLPIIAMTMAIMISHPLTINKTKMHKIIFISYITINLGYLLANLILLPR